MRTNDSFVQAIKLLGECDGRDKVNKFLGGVFKVAAAVATRRGDPKAQNYIAIYTFIGRVRSMVAMGKFFAESHKIANLALIIKALHVQNVDLKRFIEIIRVVFSFLFIVCDNLALMATYNLVAISRSSMALCAKKFQTLGYIFATIFDILDYSEAVKRLKYDPPAAQFAADNAALSFHQNFIDALTNIIVLGYFNRFFKQTDMIVGNLTCAAGALGVITHWRKMK